jgi:myo-inositol 2-dehydrogenase/D-chiro-inositol 1-dehydrogenase
MNRREFVIKSSVALTALAAPTIVPSSVFGANAPSNRINVAFIGTGRQAFGANIPQMLAVPGVQSVCVCDVDSWRLAQAQSLVNSLMAKRDGLAAYNGCAIKSDFRDLLADPNIDALMISTPDHWHVPIGLAAARAKKHFALEKPLTLNVQQGRQLADAVARSGVTNRTDSEFRSIRAQNHAVELIRNGHIGKLEKIVVVLPFDPPPVGVQPDMAVPPELNYDLWLGPTAAVPYTEKRVHDGKQVKLRPNWMRISTYAQGMIANWGAHYFDVAQWTMNTEHSGPVAVEGRGQFPVSLWNTMINFKVQYAYANGVVMTCEQTPTSTPSITYYGSSAWIKVDGYPGTMTASKPELVSLEPEPGELDFSKLSGTRTISSPPFAKAVPHLNPSKWATAPSPLRKSASSPARSKTSCAGILTRKFSKAITTQTPCWPLRSPGRHALLRSARGSHLYRHLSQVRVGGYRPIQPCRGSALRLVGKHLHHAVRHVSAQRRWFRHRHWRHGRLGR